ncbi:MAG: hypothetical protein SWE60_04165 [Thermodesulfobacteriota bacterium]|nr:hypothetical protein [Thermodesulfobacteriota bacterium]
MKIQEPLLSGIQKKTLEPRVYDVLFFNQEHYYNRCLNTQAPFLSS